MSREDTGLSAKSPFTASTCDAPMRIRVDSEHRLTVGQGFTTRRMRISSVAVAVGGGIVIGIDVMHSRTNFVRSH